MIPKLRAYMSYYNKYSEIYGNKTAVFYQIGKFHEIYGVDNQHIKMGNVTEIASLLNIRETRCSGSILENSEANPQMAGFNSVSIDEYVDKLVGYGYTVIVVNQVPGTNPIERDLAYIQSPSTTTSLVLNNNRDPYLVSIYIDHAFNKETGKKLSYIGMAAIDNTTGKSHFYETNSTVSDPTLAEDELTRFLQTFTPVEVVLNYSKKATQDSEFIRNWGFRLKNEESGLRPTVFTETQDSISNLSYQEEFLTKYFPNHGHLDVLEYLELVRYDVARLAYVYMLDFCSNHNSRILQNLSKPEIWNEGSRLILDTSSIIQLNIVESYYNQDKQNSVLSMLTKYTRTPMGRRTLKSWLLNPITDINSLKTRYDCIEKSAEKVANMELVSMLTKIRDLDRLYRKMCIGVLSPADFFVFNDSLNRCLTVREIIGNTYPEISQMLTCIPSILNKYKDVIDFEEAGKYSITENIKDTIFKHGWNSEIDQLSSQIKAIVKFRKVLCQNISNRILQNSEYCKYHEDLTGSMCYLSLTKAQYRNFNKNKPHDGLIFVVDGKTYSIDITDFQVDDRNKSNVKIKLELLSTMLSDYNKLISKLRKLTIQHYSVLLENISKEIRESMNNVSNGIGMLDVYLGIYNLSKEYNYVRPNIVESDKSYIKTDRLRHPLIERKNTYIPQDITLGIDDQCGMLLYGVNQSGKSCTMKSIGIAVVLAQTGFFVPAQKFEFSPYHLLSTRILGNDSIDRGLSTFAVEMIELRSILTRCNSRSLALGDEVCHGTESASAVAIVAASIAHLSESQSSFIFATHLHELSKMEEVLCLENVKHYHLSIDFSGDQIVYCRTMKSGSGLGLYGIEVAKHLRIPSNVLEKAYEIRNKYYSDTTKLSDLKQSRYNSNVVLSNCKVSDCKSKAAHSHHIRLQAIGDVVDGNHKDNADNIVPLCEHCHHMTHGKTKDDQILVIFGYHQDGSLDYKYRKKHSSLL
jgi:DNA mismatch repair protein MutS